MTSFIKNSQKLIYIGFGSMPAANPQKTAQMLIDAVKQANAQAIIATGWGGIASDVDWPSNIYAVREVPHEWMFKHVKTAIHHGGRNVCSSITGGMPIHYCTVLWRSTILGQTALHDRRCPPVDPLIEA